MMIGCIWFDAHGKAGRTKKAVSKDFSLGTASSLVAAVNAGLLVPKLGHNAEEHKGLLTCIQDLMESLCRDVGSGARSERVILAIQEQRPFPLHNIEDVLPRVGVLWCKAPFAEGEHPHDIVFPPLVWTYEYLLGNLMGSWTHDLLFFDLITM